MTMPRVAPRTQRLKSGKCIRAQLLPAMTVGSYWRLPTIVSYSVWIVGFSAGLNVSIATTYPTSTTKPTQSPRTCQTLALTVQSMKATCRPSGEGTA